MASAKPKTAQEYHSEATRVTSKLFWAPPPRVTIIPCIILSIVGGFLVAAPRLDWWVAAYAVVLFGVPTLLAGLLTKPLAELLGGRTYFRRTALLALAGLAFAVGVAAASRGIEAIVRLAVPSISSSLSPQRLTILAWGVPLWLRHLVMLATSESRTSRSLLPSSIQTLAAYLLTPLVLPFAVGDAVFAVLVFLFFLGSSMLFAELANRPMRKSFGYDGLWLMSQFLDHMTERGSASQDKVEGFFQSISMPSQVHVGAIAFASASRMKAVIIVPSAHPGPLGTLGGSDLPRKLAHYLFELSPAVMVPKGPCTHDQNIATLAECRRIGDKVGELVEGAKSLHGGTKSATATVGKATAMAQFFGETALIVCSLAPNPTDDIDSATGHAARQEAKAAGAADAIFVDAHNCMEVGSGLTHFGSRASHDIIAASRKAVESAKGLRFDTIGIGYASMPYIGNPDDGLGPLGIQVLIVEAGGQKTAYILFDGNNMVCGLREEIIGAVKGMVDVAEVLTSDDHAVNMTMGGFNPAGMKMDRASLVDKSKELTELAVRDLSFSQSAAGTGHIDDLRIFGPESSARLTTGINLTVAILKPALALSVSLAVALSLLALFLIP
jgi:putative membrane protein